MDRFDTLVPRIKSLVVETPLVGRPAAAPGITRLNWKAARVIEASPRSANKVRQWVRNDVEALFLGAKKSASVDEIREWIGEGVAFIVELDGEPGAFMNVARAPAGDGVEVGRLVVDPALRRRGLGATVLHHVCSAIRSIDPEIAIYGRVVETNDDGLRFLEWMPFGRLPEPPFPRSEDEIWHRYRLRPVKSRLGEVVRTLRERRHLSQADLAFQCGEGRSLINMVERNRRHPSKELLTALYQGLAVSEDDRLQLLYALVGTDTPESIHVFPTIAEEDPTDAEGFHLWVVSDDLAEGQLGLARFLRSSVRALKAGRMRFYFLPKWKVEGAMNLFREELDTRFTEYAKGSRPLLRFYEAPEYLCNLRAAVCHEPGMVKGVTIEGHGRRRVPLSAASADKFFRGLQEAVSRLEHGREGVVDGIRRRDDVPTVSRAGGVESESASKRGGKSA